MNINGLHWVEDSSFPSISFQTGEISDQIFKDNSNGCYIKRRGGKNHFAGTLNYLPDARAQVPVSLLVCSDMQAVSHTWDSLLTEFRMWQIKIDAEHCKTRVLARTVKWTLRATARPASIMGGYRNRTAQLGAIHKKNIQTQGEYFLPPGKEAEPISLGSGAYLLKQIFGRCWAWHHT